MPKINEIRYEQSKNIGQYESRKLAISVTPDEGETVTNTIESVEEIVLFYLNRPEREKQKADLEKERDALQANAVPTPEETGRVFQIERWLDHYAETASKVAALGL